VAGFWCWTNSALFIAVLEGGREQYHYSTFNTFYSTRLKRMDCGADQPMLYLKENLKEE
jgi:hypothetical protein